MRSKEEAYDYRYFPEPDLVPVDPPEEWVASIKASLPPMPSERRERIAEMSGLPAGSEAVVTVVRLGLDDLVEAVGAQKADTKSAGGASQAVAAIAVKRAANEVASDLAGAANLERSFFAKLVRMESSGQLTSAQARTVLKSMLEAGGDPEVIAEGLGFEAMESGGLEAIVEDVIAAHPEEWARYSEGEDKLAGFFIGHIKQATQGKADLKSASALLRSRR